MPSKKKWRWLLFFWVTLFLAMTVVDYLLGQYSDSFAYAKKVVSTSSLIQKETGGVKSVSLCWFWGFRYRDGYGNATSGVDLRVEGVRRSFDVTLDLKQVNYQWRIVHSSVPL